MTLFKLAGIVFLGLLVCTIVFVIFIRFKTQNNDLQQKFLSGKVPSPLPNGTYNGKVNSESNWLGKKFDRERNTGTNIFNENGVNVEKYPFKSYVGVGSVDKNLKVLKVDYNVPQNPWYLRFIVDEVVEIAPNHLLGKLIIRILPNFSLPISYFELSQ